MIPKDPAAPPSAEQALADSVRRMFSEAHPEPNGAVPVKLWPLLDDVRSALAAYDTALAAPAVAGDAHIANEWADMACNGVQWLRNLRDGIAALPEALAAMEADAARIQALQSARATPAPGGAAPQCENCSPDTCACYIDGTSMPGGAVPEGWQLVPKRLTEEMRRGTWRAQYEHVRAKLHSEKPALVAIELAEAKVCDPVQAEQDQIAFDALLAAAPTPPPAPDAATEGP